MSTQDTRKAELEKALITAALDLAAHTQSHGFSIPVPGTTPQLVVCLKEEEPFEYDRRRFERG